MYQSSPCWVPGTILGVEDSATAGVDRVWEASEVPPHLTCVWVLTGQCLHGILVSVMLAANSDAQPRQGKVPDWHRPAGDLEIKCLEEGHHHLAPKNCCRGRLPAWCF